MTLLFQKEIGLIMIRRNKQQESVLGFRLIYCDC